jgi:cell division septation protein DedD
LSDDLSIPNPTYRVPRRRRGMDSGTRRLALIAGGLGVALIAVVGGWELMGHRGTTVPVVQADNRPVRVKPDNPGGMQVAGANEDILSGGTESAAGKLAPPPEAPEPMALRAPTPAAPPPVAVPAPAPALAPAPPPIALATPTRPVVAAKPAEPTVEKRPVAAPSGNGALVQLAAVRSEDAAKSEWERLSKRLPELLGPRHPAFSKTEHDGRTLWRVRTGGFADVPQATSFCEKVRAKGAACSVAEF